MAEGSFLRKLIKSFHLNFNLQHLTPCLGNIHSSACLVDHDTDTNVHGRAISKLLDHDDRAISKLLDHDTIDYLTNMSASAFKIYDSNELFRKFNNFSASFSAS